jgi:hypothetical protein
VIPTDCQRRLREVPRAPAGSDEGHLRLLPAVTDVVAHAPRPGGSSQSKQIHTQPTETVTSPTSTLTLALLSASAGLAFFVMKRTGSVASVDREARRQRPTDSGGPGQSAFRSAVVQFDRNGIEKVVAGSGQRSEPGLGSRGRRHPGAQGWLNARPCHRAVGDAGARLPSDGEPRDRGQARPIAPWLGH